MNNIRKPKPSTSQLTSSPKSTEAMLQGRFRKYLTVLLATLAPSIVGCDEDQPPLPTRGSSCVTVLNQADKPMQGCRFDYKIPQSVLDEDAAYFAKWGSGKTPDNLCVQGDGGSGGNAGEGTGGSTNVGGNEGADGGAEEIGNRFLAYGTPGTKTINVECDRPATALLDEPVDKLIGHVDVDIDKGQEGEHSSRLINSICTDDYKYVITPQNTTVTLNDHLGRSTATWCVNELSEAELVQTVVVDQILDCSNMQDCEPIDGRKLLTANGIPGQYAEGNPKHLTFSAGPYQVPSGKEYTVWITLKQTGNSAQLINVPIIINGAVCGNDIIEHNEECDGENFQNNESCANLGFIGGDIKCTEECKRSTEDCVW